MKQGGGSPDEARLKQTPYPFHNLALFRHKITLYRFNQGAHTIKWEQGADPPQPPHFNHCSVHTNPLTDTDSKVQTLPALHRICKWTIKLYSLKRCTGNGHRSAKKDKLLQNVYKSLSSSSCSSSFLFNVQYSGMTWITRDQNGKP